MAAPTEKPIDHASKIFAIATNLSMHAMPAFYTAGQLAEDEIMQVWAASVTFNAIALARKRGTSGIEEIAKLQAQIDTYADMILAATIGAKS